MEPTGGAYNAPRPLSLFKGATSKERNEKETRKREGKRRGEEEGEPEEKGREWKGPPHPLTQKFLDPPVARIYTSFRCHSLPLSLYV